MVGPALVAVPKNSHALAAQRLVFNLDGRRLCAHRRTDMRILETLAPVFLVILLGFGLRKRGWLTDGFLAEANRVVFWVGLPAFLFISLATASHEGAPVGRLLAMLLLATATTIALGWLVARLLGLRREAVGTFVQATFRGNLAYVALPVLAALPGDSGASSTAALLVMAPLLALYNATGVTLLLASQRQPGIGRVRRVATEVLKNPLFWACVAGGLYGWLGLPMPHWLDRTFGTVGQMSLPLALICIGGALAVPPPKANRRDATVAALLKTMGQPLFGWLFARSLGLSPGDTQVGLILLATPTAAATYTMVTQLGGDDALAASSILLSTLFSVAALAVIVGAF